MSLFNMFRERKEQLKNQEVIDIVLTKLKCTCPDLVSEYLLMQRKITRNQQYKIINSSFVNIYDEMQMQLNVNNKITNRFLGISMSCIELAKICKEG